MITKLRSLFFAALAVGILLPASSESAGVLLLAGGGVVLTPCNAGQLDYSLATGCNVVFYVGGVAR